MLVDFLITVLSLLSSDNNVTLCRRQVIPIRMMNDYQTEDSQRLSSGNSIPCGGRGASLTSAKGLLFDG